MKNALPQLLVVIAVALVVENIDCRTVVGQVVSGTVRSLDGRNLTTEVLNELGARQNPPLPALSAAQYQNIFTIIVEPRSARTVVQSTTFNPATAEYRVNFRAVDPNDRLVRIFLSAGGRLESVNLEGLAAITQAVSVVMPIAKQQIYYPCDCSRCRRPLFRRFRCATVTPAAREDSGGEIVPSANSEKQLLAKNHSAPIKSNAGSEFRVWTAKDSARTAVAKLVRIQDGVPVFVRADGKLTKTSVANLSLADREWIANWQQAQSIKAETRLALATPASN